MAWAHPARYRAQMALQGDYGNNLATINSNLNTMLSNLSQQELQVLSDYYNNMANYAYQVTNDEADRALQQAQLALQQQQAAYDQQYQAQQLAMQQAQWEWQKQQAAYEQEQNRKLQQAAYYQSMYDNGSLSDAGLVNALSNLGLISGGYWPNGSYTQSPTTAQLERLLAQADLQAQLLSNAKKANGGTASTGSASGANGGTGGTGGNQLTEQQQNELAKTQNLLNLWYTGNPSTNLLTMTANDIAGRLQ